MPHMGDFPGQETGGCDVKRAGFSTPQAAMTNFLGEEMEMAKIPVWIDVLQQSGSATDDFIRYLNEIEASSLKAVSDAVEMGDLVKAQVESGKRSAFYTMRCMFEAYLRERKQQLAQHDDQRRG